MPLMFEMSICTDIKTQFYCRTLQLVICNKTLKVIIRRTLSSRCIQLMHLCSERNLYLNVSTLVSV